MLFETLRWPELATLLLLEAAGSRHVELCYTTWQTKASVCLRASEEWPYVFSTYACYNQFYIPV
jgi:hypothetical protein